MTATIVNVFIQALSLSVILWVVSENQGDVLVVGLDINFRVRSAIGVNCLINGNI